MMYNRLLLILNKYNVTYDYLFGFRKSYSTYMVRLTLIDKVSEALEKEKNVIGIFLDFSKAFETIDHNGVLNKMQYYGVPGIAIFWFQSYWSNRISGN